MSDSLRSNFGLSESLRESLRPKLGTEAKPKNDFTFWINFDLSPNLELSEK